MSDNKKRVKKGGSRGYRIVYTLFAWLVRIFFNYKVIGKERERAEGRYIVAANHVSGTDPVALCYAFHKNQICFMGKKELFKIPVLGWLLKFFGAFPVDRGGSDVGAIKKAVKIVDEGRCLGIFPQGHRYPGEDPRATKTKNGMALIATKAAADIVPVFLWRKDNKFKLFRRTYIIIGDPIPFDSLAYNPDEKNEYSRITDIVFDKICTLGENFDKNKI